MTFKPVIEARRIRKAYRLGDNVVWALKGIDVTIENGEFVAVMGPSGSGKSTFMHLAGCLDRPTDGTLFLNGKDVSALDVEQLARARNRYIGFVFQQFNLLPRTDAIENVCLPLLYSDVPEHEWHSRAKYCLELVGLADRMHHRPAQLSGGQQQRVAIARALINDPLLLLADEPTGALDTHTSEEIMQLFQELNDTGKTIVLVTHEPEIAAFAKRRLVFRDGALVSDEHNEPRVVGMMTIKLFKTALTALRVNVLRSVLTMLGIIIGVSAVIIMVALGAGAQREVDAQIEALGGNIFMLMGSFRRMAGANTAAGSVQSLTADHANLLEKGARQRPGGRARGQRRCAGRFRQSQLVDERHRHGQPLLRHAQLAGRQRPRIHGAGNRKRRQGRDHWRYRARGALRRRRPDRRDDPNQQSERHDHRLAHAEGTGHGRSGPGRRDLDAPEDRAYKAHRPQQRQSERRAAVNDKGARGRESRVRGAGYRDGHERCDARVGDRGRAIHAAQLLRDGRYPCCNPSDLQ